MRVSDWIRVRVRIGTFAVIVQRRVVFVEIIVLLTSLTCRLLGLRRAFREVTWVAWKRYKTRLNRALRLLDASSTLLAVVWSFWAAFGLILDALDAFWDAFWMPFSLDLSLFLCTFRIHFTSLIFASTLHCYFMDSDAIDTLKITFLLQFYFAFFKFWHIQTHAYFMDSGMFLNAFWHTRSRLVRE